MRRRLSGRVDALVAGGDIQGAIAVLSAAQEDEPDAEIERRLVSLRHDAFAALPSSTPCPSWPPTYDQPLPVVGHDPPEVPGAELSGDVIGRGVTHHGCVVVRSLVPPVRVDELVAGIDHVFAEFGERGFEPGPAGRWFQPFDPPGSNLGGLRRWVAGGHALWLADSPPMMFLVQRALRECGATAAVEGYLGERAVMSQQKTTLRRVPPDERATTWHQDGAFLDDGIRAVNLWIALTRCGGGADAPGLEILPRRFDAILETGNAIAGPDRPASARAVPHAISDELAADTALAAPARCPSFQPGDALVFDEMLPHRTAVAPGLTRPRYAIETWFFAASSFPRSYTPIVC
jgi:hypothetical protein